MLSVQDEKQVVIDTLTELGIIKQFPRLPRIKKYKLAAYTREGWSIYGCVMIWRDEKLYRTGEVNDIRLYAHYHHTSDDLQRKIIQHEAVHVADAFLHGGGMIAEDSDYFRSSLKKLGGIFTVDKDESKVLPDRITTPIGLEKLSTEFVRYNMYLLPPDGLGELSHEKPASETYKGLTYNKSDKSDKSDFPSLDWAYYNYNNKFYTNNHDYGFSLPPKFTKTFAIRAV